MDSEDENMSTNMSIDFEVVLEKTVTVLKSLGMNVDECPVNEIGECPHNEIGENVNVYESPVNKIGENVNVYESPVNKIGENVNVYEGPVNKIGENINVYESPVNKIGDNVKVYESPVNEIGDNVEECSHNEIGDSVDKCPHNEIDNNVNVVGSPVNEIGYKHNIDKSSVNDESSDNDENSNNEIEIEDIGDEDEVTDNDKKSNNEIEIEDIVDEDKVTDKISKTDESIQEPSIEIEDEEDVVCVYDSTHNEPEIDYQSDFLEIALRILNEGTKKPVEDDVCSDMDETYGETVPDEDAADWTYEVTLDSNNTEDVKFVEINPSRNKSDPCAAASGNNSGGQRNDGSLFGNVRSNVAPPVIDPQTYEKRVQERFNLINRYCDTRYEPVTFNSPRKRWMVPPGSEFDCLDYVVCYNTIKKGVDDVVRHWHYVTFGLSDIHGPPLETPNPAAKSGLGYELTFRVQHDDVITVPPVWPVAFLQRLALYIISNKIHVEPGDCLGWGPSLDYQRPGSPIRNMLVASDRAFPTLHTPTGYLKHFQIVGVTREEVETAQNWKGSSLLEMFMQLDSLGGPYLVTDMDRMRSIFDMYPETLEIVRKRVKEEGSDLTGVNANILWSPKPRFETERREFDMLCDQHRKEFEQTYPGIRTATSEINSSICHQMNSEGFVDLLCQMVIVERDKDCDNYYSKFEAADNATKPPPRAVPAVHLTMDSEALLMLALVIRGRLGQNRHFTYKSHMCNDTITFVPENMPGAFANKDCPFVADGRWLHICLSKELQAEILENLTGLLSDTSKKLPYPKLLCYDQYKFAISVLSPNQAIFKLRASFPVTFA